MEDAEAPVRNVVDRDVRDIQVVQDRDEEEPVGADPELNVREQRGEIRLPEALRQQAAEAHSREEGRQDQAVGVDRPPHEEDQPLGEHDFVHQCGEAREEEGNKEQGSQLHRSRFR